MSFQLSLTAGLAIAYSGAEQCFKCKPFSHVVASLPRWPTVILAFWNSRCLCFPHNLYHGQSIHLLEYVRSDDMLCQRFLLCSQSLVLMEASCHVTGSFRWPSKRSMRPGAEAFSFISFHFYFKSWYWNPALVNSSKNYHLLIIILIEYLLPLYIFENCPQH